MFFKARKAKARRDDVSKSNHSNESIQSHRKIIKPSIIAISATQLKLRDAINCKFQKSKIAKWKYKREEAKQDETSESANSEDMPQYQDLKEQRFVNIKEYHRKATELPGQKYLIRKRRTEQKRSVTQNDTLSPLNLHETNKRKEENKLLISKDFVNSDRKTFSQEKKYQWQKIGFDFITVSKKVDRKYRPSPDKSEEHSKLNFFRRQQKKPKSQVSFHL